jgi:hypothetical protein
LSSAYKISYEQLMAMAGYISAGKKRGADAPKPSALNELNLTPEEEIELLEYLQFRRAQKEKSSK